MASIHPEYVVDEHNQKKSVVLPLAEWNEIVDKLEELDDIRAFDEAKSRPSDPIPFDEAVREIERGESG
jgi:hypothetical protein